MISDEIRVVVAADTDIIEARRRGREFAERIGFSRTDVTLIATAISEIARNMMNYAGSGDLLIRLNEQHNRRSIEIVAEDHGPGIPDVEQALEFGYSTGRGLGLGLPGARRVMDEFEIRSTVGVGTTVVMKKWLRS